MSAPDSEHPAEERSPPAADGGAASLISRELVARAGPIAEACRASAIFAYVEALGGGELPLPDELRAKVVYVSRSAEEERAEHREPGAHLRVASCLSGPITARGAASRWPTERRPRTRRSPDARRS